MPYIEQEVRDALDIGSRPPETLEELNYCLTALVDVYLTSKGVTYTSLNGVVGALECAKQELYRRIAAPYEDEQAEKNGDVFVCARS